MEVEFKNADLPVLGENPFDFFTIKNFENFMDPEIDILSSIKQFNPIVAASNKNEKDRIEVRYSYIDFTWMIIGEKIRNMFKKPIKFDDLYYAKMIDLENDNKLSFFGESSVINIVDSQWRTTQEVQQIIFIIYMTLFVLPMCVSSFKISPEVDSLMFYIATLPSVLMLFIEIIQMRYQGASYISTGWNMIDMA